MNVKKRHQGLGYFQIDEQIQSESIIVEYLAYLSSQRPSLDSRNEKFLHPWATIRSISRRTGLHHVTIGKAIERLKKTGEVLEVHGTHNARLFCLSGSENADYLKKNNFVLMKSPIESQTSLRRSIIDKFRLKNKTPPELWGRIKTKRETISLKNKMRIM